MNSIKENKCSNLNINFDLPRIGVKGEFNVVNHQESGISWHKKGLKNSKTTKLYSQKLSNGRDWFLSVPSVRNAFYYNKQKTSEHCPPRTGWSKVSRGKSYKCKQCSIEYPVTTASTPTTTTSATTEKTRSRLTPDHAANSIKQNKCSNLNTNFDVPRIGVKGKFKIAYHQRGGISWRKYSSRTSYRKVTQNFHSG